MARALRSRFRRRFARARDVALALIARDTMVVTNAIAFNFLLCLFPLLLVLTAAAQAFPGRRASAALLLVLHELIPFEREALAQSVQGLRRIAPGLQVFSLLVIVWGSSGIFMPIELALGRAWGCEPRSFLKSRLLAFLATLGGASIAFLSVGMTVLARSYKDVGGAVALRSALWAGTVWEVAKYLFVINLQRANLRVYYGPLAFAVSLVMWAYVSSLVLVFGALMTPVPARKAGGAASRA